MNKQKAIDILKKYPKAPMCLVTRDATGHWYDWHPVWLSIDGSLVMAHPTDDKREPINTPDDGAYHVQG